MRIWDISPGYLNRQSLLGEHRELHGLMNIIVLGKKGYSRHPETLRWISYPAALAFRHRQLAAEMALRGYTDQSPVPDFPMPEGPREWPPGYIDSPGDQYRILKEKYRDKEEGRIPLPENAQQMWAQHKYSILARDQEEYRRLGRMVSEPEDEDTWMELAETLVTLMRVPPSAGGIRNALFHMWGYVNDSDGNGGREEILDSPNLLLGEIQRRIRLQPQEYLLASTALSDLGTWNERT